VLLLIQFPIADFRPFLAAERTRLPTPAWPKPNTYRRFIRSFGRTRRRRKDPDLGVWQDELYYSDARRGIRLPRLEKQILGPEGALGALRAAFRRLFCDGGPSVRVEVAIGADTRRPLQARETLAVLRDFLNLQTQVMRHRPIAPDDRDAGFEANAVVGPLYDQGPRLARLWLEATTKIRADTLTRGVDACVPVVLVGYRANEIATLPGRVHCLEKKSAEDVDLGYLNLEHHGLIIGVWFLNLDSAEEDQRRKLRIATLRLHAEQQVLARVVQRVKSRDILYQPGDPGSAALSDYINMATAQLFKSRRFGVDQPILRETIAAHEAAVGPGERQLILDQLTHLQPQIREKLDRFLQPGGLRVFISFSRQDGEQWLELVKRHLKPLAKAGYIEYWADTEIVPGENWDQKIQESLRNAAVVVLLVGPGLFASDYVYDKELPVVLERWRRDEIELIPVFLLPVSRLTAREVLDIQGINQPNQPLQGMSIQEQNACLARLVERLGAILGIERLQ